MTRYANVKEQDQACAAILVDNLRGYVKCEGRRWYLWDDDNGGWKRTTVGYALCHRIVREVERLIVQARGRSQLVPVPRSDGRPHAAHPAHVAHLPGEPSATPSVGVGLAEWVGRGLYTPTPPLDAPRGSSAIPPLV